MLLSFLANPISITSEFEASRWILLGVFLLGVLLAYITDEGYTLITGEEESQVKEADGSVLKGEDGKKPQSHQQESIAELLIPALIRHTFVYRWIVYSLSGVLAGLGRLRPYMPARMEVLIARFEVFLALWSKRLSLYLRARHLKKVATSKRHYFYLLEKDILALPVKPNETEIESYLDCKRFLGNKWPFMWAVKDVKNDKILCDNKPCVPMSSYSYLDMMRVESVQKAAIEAANVWSTGNHGPRMLGGNMEILIELERKIAEFFHRDGTLLCATGYLACMSACAAICTESAVVFGDSRLHASLRAGLKIGEGKTVIFKHNNFEDCEKKILEHRRKFKDAWMVIESVYSMDGDIADLPAAVKLCKKYDIKLVIDEAHGLGVVGPTGRGLEEHFNMLGQAATLIVGTFSKSIASIGGYICGPRNFIDYLDFHAPGNVFSAPLPAYCAGAALESFRIIMENPSIVSSTQEKSRLFRKLLESGDGHWPADYCEADKYVVEGDEVTTVLPVVFHDDIDRVMRIATSLKKKGWMVSAVAYPACPLRSPRFRITCTAAYDEPMMRDFTKVLVETTVEEKPSAFRELVK